MLIGDGKALKGDGEALKGDHEAFNTDGKALWVMGGNYSWWARRSGLWKGV